MRCGAEHKKPSGNFFKIANSEQYLSNGGYSCICVPCVKAMFDKYTMMYKSSKTACVLICHILDIPFYHAIYDNIVANNSDFSIGLYLRQLNNRKYHEQSFCTTLVNNELGKSYSDVQGQAESRWTKQEIRNKEDAIAIIGYDPFEGYPITDRRFLFNEIVKYLDEDSADDAFRISQVIQIVNNNNQIRCYDYAISRLDPIKDAEAIRDLNVLKRDLVSSTDKIAKENEISVKNRSNKEAGKSTLTFLMRYLRELNFDEAEADYYSQLSSSSSQWAADMSFRAIKQNCFFDENDKEDIFEMQRSMIESLQKQVDTLTEDKRLLLVKLQEIENPSDDIETGDIKDGDEVSDDEYDAICQIDDGELNIMRSPGTLIGISISNSTEDKRNEHSGTIPTATDLEGGVECNDEAEGDY